MNHLREKWATRARPASSSASDSTGDASPVRRRGPAPPTATPAAASKAPEPLRRAMSTLETQRFDALAAWIKRSGIAIPQRDRLRRDADVFDEIYESLEGMEAAIKRDLALLLPKWQSSVSEPVATPSRGVPVVDYMVVIGPDMNDLLAKTFWRGQSELYEATVVLAHPPQSQFNAECFEQFCFPDGIQVDAPDTPSEEFFVLMLSGGGDQGQDVQYACCLRQGLSLSTENGPASIPVCYAAVVRTPWISFFQPLLRHLSEKHQTELKLADTREQRASIVPDAFVQHVDSLMTELNLARVPGRGEVVRFAIDGQCEPHPALALSCLRPRIDCGSPENTALLLEWSTPLLLSALSIQHIILAVGLLLVEMKVVIISKSIPLLSAGTLGISSLLYPLVWAGPLISVLPPALHEYLEAPVPLLCGVEALPSGFVLTKGTAIILLDKNEIQLHPDDAAQLGAFQFPGSEELTRQLTFLSQSLKEKPTSFTSSIISNVVVRRTRRQLNVLLLLCARINPYNAHACMKQERLSLSETLFLKAFMQSQMYQKYSDDQPLVAASSCEKQEEEPADIMSPLKSSVNQVAVRSLRHPIHELFSIAVTGSVPIEKTEDLELKMKTISENSRARVQNLSGITADGQNSADFIPAYMALDQMSCSMNAEDLPDSTEWLTPCQLPSESDDEIDHCFVGSHELDIAKTSDCAQISEIASDDELRTCLPISSDVFSDTSEHEVCMASPILSEGIMSSCHAQVESGTQSQANDELYEPSAAYQSGPPSLTIVARTVAAMKIQSAWRQHQRCIEIRKESRGSLLTCANEPVDHTGGKVSTDLGIPLLLDVPDGRITHIIMSLTSDKNSIKWSAEELELGSVQLDHIDEVRAEGDKIVICMMNGRHCEFSIPLGQANVTMGFFHDVHRLATSGIRSPAHCEETTGSSATPIMHSSQLENMNVEEESSSVYHTPREGIKCAPSSFYDNIRRGVLVLKHGRMGRPHPKYLMCDDDIRELLWIDPAITNSGYHAPHHGMHARAAEFKSIRFVDIVNVLPGKQTRVFQRPTAGRSNADLCFSIVTRGRTLDIEAFTREEYVLLLDGIKQRVGAY